MLRLGILTPALALAGVLLFLFAPLNSWEECTATASDRDETAVQCESGRSSVVEDEGRGAVLIVLLLASPTALTLLGAWRYARTGGRSGRVNLWFGAIGLVALTWLALFSAGVFLLPSVITVFCAAGLAHRSAPREALP